MAFYGQIDHRIIAPLAWAFREGGPGDRPDPWTRAELATATGLAEATITTAVEALAEAGFLLKGKKGSRAVYSRPQECRTARPDLPSGWWWQAFTYYPRQVRTVQVEVVTNKWSPEGSAMTLGHIGDPPSHVTRSLGSEAHVRELAKHGIGTFRGVQAAVDSWRTERDKIAARALLRAAGHSLGFEVVGDNIQVPFGDDRLQALADFAWELAHEAYRERSARGRY